MSPADFLWAKLKTNIFVEFLSQIDDIFILPFLLSYDSIDKQTPIIVFVVVTINYRSIDWKLRLQTFDFLILFIVTRADGNLGCFGPFESRFLLVPSSCDYILFNYSVFKFVKNVVLQFLEQASHILIGCQRFKKFAGLFFGFNKQAWMVFLIK